MAKAKYRVEYDDLAVEELKALRRFDQVNVLAAIEEHLLDRPARPSGTRIKKLDPPVVASYWLRVGDLRVFYDVDETARVVSVIAVRAKGRKTLQEAADESAD